MVIRNLQSLLLQNTHLISTEEKLEDTRLIIDCNNLQHYLLDHCFLGPKAFYYQGDILGGNLVGYESSVRTFFAQLAKCNIKPILVVDESPVVKTERATSRVGCPAEVGHQLELAKGRAHIDNIERVEEGTKKARRFITAIPRLFKVVFDGVVKELAVELIRTNQGGTTSAAMVKLANDLQCPVLASSGDLILQPLDHGFIIMERFSAYPFNGYRYLNCRVYRRERLLECLAGENVDSLPLLNVLLSKAAEEWAIFKPMVESICCKQIYTGRLEAEYYRHEEMAILLDWLSMRSRQEALAQILANIDQDKRELAQEFAQSFLDANNSPPCKNLRGILEHIYQLGDRSSEDDREEGTASPIDYLLEACANRYLSVPFLNIISGGRIYESECINDLSQPASSRLKLRIYSIVATLVRIKAHDEELDKTISVFGRIGTQYEETRVEPMRELEDYGSLDQMDIYKLLQMTKEERRRLLMAAFRFSQEELDQIKSMASRVFKDELYCNEFLVGLVLLKYIGIETRRSPGREFVYAFVWALFYHYKNEQLFQEGEPSISEPSRNLMKRLARHTTMKNGFNYRPDPEDYWQIVHLINSLQVIYEAYFALNDLLDCPMTRPSPGSWLNGLFIFRLVRLVKCEKDALLEYCRLLPELRRLCRSAYDLVANISN